jgi:hypothetical protein
MTRPRQLANRHTRQPFERDASGRHHTAERIANESPRRRHRLPGTQTHRSEPYFFRGK